MDCTTLQVWVGGILALVGGFFGAWLTRRTEYEKWLRQQRSTEFAAFLLRLHEIRTEATNEIYTKLGDEHSRNINATELFAGLSKYESVARLYMSKPGRSKLSTLTNDLWVNCTTKGGPANQSHKIKVIESSIQALIEEELENIPWEVRWKWPF